MIGQIIGMIFVGGILGALARLFLKGDQQLSVLWTIVLGAVGAAVGAWIATLLHVGDTNGVDWIRWIISIACTMVFITLFISLRRSRGAGSRH